MDIDITSNTSRPENLRNMGGIPCYNDRKILPGKLLRSGQLTNLSEADKDRLVNTLKLSQIVDFRSAQEVTKEPDEELHGTEYLHLDLFKKAPGLEPGSEKSELNSTPEETQQFMLNTYAMLVTNEEAVTGYRKFAELLLTERSGALLFHCFAGKDRTGVAAAIILEALGAKRGTIFDDYLRSNEQRREVNTALIAKLRQHGLSDEHLASVELALSVSRDYLENMYKAADKAYGSFDGFLRDALGIDENAKARLREMYLAQ